MREFLVREEVTKGQCVEDKGEGEGKGKKGAGAGAGGEEFAHTSIPTMQTDFRVK